MLRLTNQSVCALSSVGRALDFFDKTKASWEGDSMLSAHFQGRITELQVARAFLELGYQVSQPLVSDSRYDFIVDIKGRLFKIQVKTATISEDGNYFYFATSTSHTNTKGTINRSYTADEIDYFATIYDGQCYLMPIEECGHRQQRLRLQLPKNGQIAGIKFAKDYLLQDAF